MRSFITFMVAFLVVFSVLEITDSLQMKQIPLSQRITDKNAPEHVTCYATGVLMYDGDITKDGVETTDGKLGFHDLKTGRGVVIENPFCVTTIPVDKYPELVPATPKSQEGNL